MKGIENAYITAVETIYRNYCLEPIHSSKTSLFTLKEEIEFMPDIISYMTSSSESKICRPVRFIFTVASVKNTSKILHINVVDVTTGHVLIKSALWLVFVDVRTRRPTPFPAGFRNFINSHEVPPFQWTNDYLKTIPANARVFQRQRKVVLTECDYNIHANHSMFVLFALECVGEALAQGFPMSLSGQFCQQILNKVRFFIVGEVGLGKTVKCKFWQSNDGLFHFIHSLADAPVAYVTISFFKM